MYNLPQYDLFKLINRNEHLQSQSLLPPALQLASQLYIVVSEFGLTLLLLTAIFLQLSQLHLALQLSPLHKQEVNQLVLMHLTCGHKPSPAEQFRVTTPSLSMQLQYLSQGGWHVTSFGSSPFSLTMHFKTFS